LDTASNPNFMGSSRTNSTDTGLFETEFISTRFIYINILSIGLPDFNPVTDPIESSGLIGLPDFNPVTDPIYIYKYLIDRSAGF
jgi:hypothetical protein